jgi:hypothetical protein
VERNIRIASYGYDGPEPALVGNAGGEAKMVQGCATVRWSTSAGAVDIKRQRNGKRREVA